MENLGVISIPRKSRSPQQSIRYKSFLRNRFANEGQNKTNATNQKGLAAKEENCETGLSPRMREFNEKKRNAADPLFPKKQSLVFGGTQKKLEGGERDRSPGLTMSKSFSTEHKGSGRERRRSVGSRSVSPPFSPKEKQQQLLQQQCVNKIKLKSPVPVKKQNNYIDNFESLALLSKAVYEQGQIIEMFCLAREEFLKKLGEKIRLDGKSPEAGGEYDYEYFPLSGEDAVVASFPQFENAYSSTLEEIFQAWVHLFYFIINLRINLVRILNYAGYEGFRPKDELEKDIIKQSIECVKFFSRLKIKSMANSVDELRLTEGQQLTPAQIRNYEQQLSSPFLCEMYFIQKKARDILCQAKTVTTM